MTARILIADDHPLTREALSALLSANGFDVVGEAPGGAEAIEQARALKPDLVVLDLTMPEVDGLTALPQIRDAAPETAVVVLTASEDDESLLTAIRLGAAGYVLKNEPPERIIAFLRGVARGEAALSGAVASRLMAQVREGGHKQDVVPQAIADKLSARELEVLLLLDQHLGTEEIAKRLFISEHTVRSHVKNLLAKLGASSRREALEQLASGRGG
jgi:DNA-binding NarL/FixJ family response regulator